MSLRLGFCVQDWSLLCRIRIFEEIEKKIYQTGLERQGMARGQNFPEFWKGLFFIEKRHKPARLKKYISVEKRPARVSLAGPENYFSRVRA